MDQARIREIAERNIRLLQAKPTKGHLTCATRARLAEGLRCEIEEGPWKLTADLPRKAGGEDSAPTPGMLGRGALASCLVIGVATWCARLHVPVDSIEVEVEADFDVRGELGMGEVRPGYKEVRYAVSVESSAAGHLVDEAIELAERSSPYLHVFGMPIPLRRVSAVELAEA